MEIAGLIVGVLGLVASGFAIYYGIQESKKRQKLEEVFKTIISGYPGDVAKIESNCKWALVSVRDAHAEALKIPDSAEKNKVLTFINNATYQAASAQKLCVPLFNHLLNFQQAQFGTRTYDYADLQSNDFELFIAEAKNHPTGTKNPDAARVPACDVSTAN